MLRLLTTTLSSCSSDGPYHATTIINAPRRGGVAGDGLTPLQLACGAESDAPAEEDVLALLLQAGAAPNANVR